MLHRSTEAISSAFGSARSPVLAALAVGTAAALGSAGLWLHAAKDPASEGWRVSVAESESSDGTVYSKGVRYSASEPGGASTELLVDRVIERRRRFGPLTLRTVDELVFERAQVTLSPGAKVGGGAGDLLEQFDAAAVGRSVLEVASALGVSNPTRLTIERLTLDIDTGSDAGWRAVADRAQITADTKELVLRDGVSISTTRGFRLDARKVRVIAEDSALAIAGVYRLFHDDRLIESDADATFVIDSDGHLTKLAD